MYRAHSSKTSSLSTVVAFLLMSIRVCAADHRPALIVINEERIRFDLQSMSEKRQQQDLGSLAQLFASKDPKTSSIQHAFRFFGSRPVQVAMRNDAELKKKEAAAAYVLYLDVKKTRVGRIGAAPGVLALSGPGLSRPIPLGPTRIDFYGAEARVQVQFSPLANGQRGYHGVARGVATGDTRGPVDSFFNDPRLLVGSSIASAVNDIEYQLATQLERSLDSREIRVRGKPNQRIVEITNHFKTVISGTICAGDVASTFRIPPGEKRSHPITIPSTRQIRQERNKYQRLARIENLRLGEPDKQFQQIASLLQPGRTWAGEVYSTKRSTEFRADAQLEIITQDGLEFTGEITYSHQQSAATYAVNGYVCGDDVVMRHGKAEKVTGPALGQAAGALLTGQLDFDGNLEMSGDMKHPNADQIRFQLRADAETNGAIGDRIAHP